MKSIRKVNTQGPFAPWPYPDFPADCAVHATRSHVSHFCGHRDWSRVRRPAQRGPVTPSEPLAAAVWTEATFLFFTALESRKL